MESEKVGSVFLRTIIRDAEALIAAATVKVENARLVKNSPSLLNEAETALAELFWSLTYSESDFYREAVRKFAVSGSAEFAGTDCVRVDAISQSVKHYRDLLPTLRAMPSTSRNLSAVCMFMILPVHVVRRWLWHENVDFQSRETFLRRLSSGQYTSLCEHFRLSVVEHAADKDLPCFQEGFTNTVWNTFGLPAATEDRMAPKSALAHNFFGFDMGFQLYPSLENDEKAPTEGARQFLQSKSKYLSAIATKDRGAFEVNKETGGLYWYLYRTLRSNDLYNTGERVELGRWICPWFWFTMLAWAVFLLVSPAALVAAVALLASGGFETGLVPFLGAVGSLTPLFLSLRWLKRKLRDPAYSDAYWKKVGSGVGIFLALFVGAIIISSFGHFATFWVLAISLIFLIPHMLKHHDLRFWALPTLGKLLPLLTLITLCHDIYRHTQFWEAVLALALGFLVYCFAHRSMIAIGLGLCASYGLAMYGIFWYAKRQKFKVEDISKELPSSIAPASPVALRLAKAEEEILGEGLFFGLGYLLLAAITIFVFRGLFDGEYLLFSVPFVFPLLLPFISAVTEEYGLKNHILGRATKEWPFGKKKSKKVSKALSANPYWFDASGLSLRATAAERLIDAYSPFNDNFDWLLIFLELVSSDEELERACTFMASGYTYSLRPKVSTAHIVLAGSVSEGAFTAIAKREGSKDEWERLLDVSDKLGAALLAVYHVIIWLPCLIWKLVGHCYLWVKAMNEACPLSPPHERGVVR